MPAQAVAVRPRAPAWAEGLDDKERRFVEQYLLDLNLTQAVLRAGITTNYDSARSIGHDVYHRPHVTTAIDKAMAADSSGIRQTLISRLMAITDANIDDFFEWTEDSRYLILKPGARVPRHLRAMVKSVEIKPMGGLKLTLHDPIRAAEVLTRFPVVAGIDAAKTEASPLDEIIKAGMRIGREQAEAAYERRQLEAQAGQTPAIEGEYTVVEPQQEPK